MSIFDDFALRLGDIWGRRAADLSLGLERTTS